MANGEYILYVTTHGMDAPMKAALTFSAAKAMGGYQPTKDQKVLTKVALLDDAVLLLAPGVADHLEVPGRGNLKDLMAAANTEIHC